MAAKRATRSPAKRASTRAPERTAPPVPHAELHARGELALRALADARALIAEGDPRGAPDDFKARQEKALAMLDQARELLPLGGPLTEKQRARLEEQLEDAPDHATMRAMLLEMARLADDPQVPASLREAVDKDQLREALRALDFAETLEPIARASHDLIELVRAKATGAAPPVDPSAAILRREAERLAAKRRS
jgi:hypothetical protein